MRSVKVHQAKTQLSALLAEVESRGESFVICRNGKPIADLVPHASKDRTVPHGSMSKIEIRYDPTEPLDPSEWLEEDA